MRPLALKMLVKADSGMVKLYSWRPLVRVEQGKEMLSHDEVVSTSWGNLREFGCPKTEIMKQVPPSKLSWNISI